MSATILVLACVGVLQQSVPVGPPARPTLADLARQEEARRKAITEPAKLLTNDDLRKLGVPVEPAPADSGTAPVAAGSPAASPAPVAAAPPQAEEPPKDEAYWRGRITEARTALDRTSLLLAAMQSRINALSADFAARDDPAQRAVLERDRQRALVELQRLTEDRDAQVKAIADIEEEARQAGVPPGWLR